MAPRSRRRAAALMVLMVVGHEVDAQTSLHPADPDRSTEVLLAASVEVPRLTVDALIDEVHRLWRPHGVDVRLLRKMPTIGDSRLRLLVVGGTDHVTWASQHVLARLYRGGEGPPLAIAHRKPAELMLKKGLGEQVSLPLSHEFHFRRLGLILGRAIAHEIGHYLLGTSWHAESGLMRATFSARELVDPRPMPFQLDQESVARLAAAREREAAVTSSRPR